MTTMYGYVKNESSFADHGFCRTDESRMFFVSGTVAFWDRKIISPGGDYSFYGENLLVERYMTLSEVNKMVEYDNTPKNTRLGCYDVCKRIEPEEKFRLYTYKYRKIGGGSYDFYVFTVKDVNKSLLADKFLLGSRIEEIRENPGKFLHVYKVRKSVYLKAQECSSFDEFIKLMTTPAL